MVRLEWKKLKSIVKTAAITTEASRKIAQYLADNGLSHRDLFDADSLEGRWLQLHENDR